MFSLVTHYKDLKSVSKPPISVQLCPLLSSFIYKHLRMKIYLFTIYVMCYRYVSIMLPLLSDVNIWVALCLSDLIP